MNEKHMKIIHDGEKIFELWKPIDDYPNYQVSSFGRIKRFYKNGKSKILKPGINANGYYRVKLSKKEKQKSFSVHRLVAQAFINNPYNKPVVDHIDNNRKNNHIHNLRWATVQENSMNSSRRYDNTSGTKGVSWHKHDKQWHARIRINGKIIQIGYYDKLEDAVKARKQKAKEIFGEFTNECER